MNGVPEHLKASSKDKLKTNNASPIANIVGKQSTFEDIGDKYAAGLENPEIASDWWMTASTNEEIANLLQNATNIPPGLAKNEYELHLLDTAVESTYLTDIEAAKNGVDETAGTNMTTRELFEALLQGSSISDHVRNSMNASGPKDVQANI